MLRQDRKKDIARNITFEILRARCNQNKKKMKKEKINEKRRRKHDVRNVKAKKKIIIIIEKDSEKIKIERKNTSSCCTLLKI